MRIIINCFCAFMFLFSATANAQTPKNKPTAPTQKPVKKVAAAAPTVSLKDMLASVKKLSTAILDPNISGSAIAGKFLYPQKDNHRIYDPAFQIAGAEQNSLEKVMVERNSYAQTGWVYHCLLAKVPGGTDSAALVKMKHAVDSCFATFPPCNVGACNCIQETKIFFSCGNISADSLAFTIHYYKKTEGSIAAVGDSIRKLYQPGMEKSFTFNSALKQFDAAITFEDLDSRAEFKEELAPVILPLLKAVYASSPDDAFSFAMDATLDLQTVVAAERQMDPAAQADIRSRAQNIVDNYKHRQDSIYYAQYYPGYVNPAATQSYNTMQRSIIRQIRRTAQRNNILQQARRSLQTMPGMKKLTSCQDMIVIKINTRSSA